MSEIMFEHDRLDVYRLAVEYTAESFGVAKTLSGLHRHARDQWLRAAQSILEMPSGPSRMLEFTLQRVFSRWERPAKHAEA